MRWDDPARGRVGDKPALQGLASIVPNWTISPGGGEPGEAPRLRVVLWVPVGPNRYVPKWAEFGAEEFIPEWRAYHEDPEGWLEQRIGWDRVAAGRGESPAAARPALPPPGIALPGDEDLF